MGAGNWIMVAVDGFAREATLFAAVWFLVGGLDDLAVDLIYAARRARRRVRSGGAPVPVLAQLDAPPTRIAIFVPAWQESEVIAPMLRNALARIAWADYRIYVGTYPNDRATLRAAASVARADPRVRLVIGAAPGPTTKADCLNTAWRALLRDEAAEGTRFAAVLLHDAEDVVHPGELRVFAHYLPDYEAIQLPVLPLRDPHSRLISGHYLDEFAESHAKQMIVRQSLGAGMPLAGVGCCIRRDALEAIAARRQGLPFDASSLTEDYELGLTIADQGGRTVLARVPEAPGGPPVAVRAYFPAELGAAVRQKARWMTGIALAGWDRVGWGRGAALGDHWMRMRDRRATLAIPVLAIAYAALVAWLLSLIVHAVAGSPVTAPPAVVRVLLLVNAALLAWRLAMRALFVARAYGWREALWSVPRVVVGNAVALLAARRALILYARMLAGGPPRWDKTAHHFPTDPERAA